MSEGGLVPHSSMLPKSKMSVGGFTLAELMVVLILLVVVGALLAPCFARASRQKKVEECAAHLTALHVAQDAFYGKPGSPAPELGRAYWEKLSKTAPPLVLSQTLLCPLVEIEGAPSVHYMGPGADPRTVAADIPIGCDFEWNHNEHGHEGGNVLLKSGAVVNDNDVNEGGLWGIATRKGKCRP